MTTTVERAITLASTSKWATGEDLIRILHSANLLMPDGDERHLIQFRDDGWTIRHPLAERLDGSLFDCDRNWTKDDPGIRGVYVLNDDGTILARLERRT